MKAHWRQREPWLLFGAALAATALAVAVSLRAVDERGQAAFAAAIEAAERRLDARLDGYGALLHATRAHLESAPHDRAGFDHFVARLQLAERYPGLRGIGWSPRLRDADDARALEAAARAEGLPGFRVWTDGDRTPAFAIRFLAPLDRRNAAALGYDMSSEPVRRDAMRRAAASGQVALSGTVVLKQESPSTGLPGFLLYLPLYEGRTLPAAVSSAAPAAAAAAPQRSPALAGFAYAPVRAADFFPTVFDGRRDGFAVRVEDGGPGGAGGSGAGATTLFDNLDRPAAAGAVVERVFDHAGQRWTLRFSALPALQADPLERGLPTAVGVVGVLVSAGLLWIATRRSQARLALNDAAAAREAALAQERVQRSVAESLSRTALQLGAERDPARAVQRVIDEATRLVGAAFGAYFHNVPDHQGHFGLYTLSGAAPEKFASFPPLRATPLFGATFGGRTVRLGDVHDSPLFGHNPPFNGMPQGHLKVTSYLGVCVKARSGRVLGGLFLGHPEPDRFRAEHEQLVEGLAAQAGVVLENVELLASERQARRVAEERKQLLDLVVEQSGEGIVVADESGTLRFFNSAAERQHGVGFEAVGASDWQQRYGLHTLAGAPLPLAEMPLFQALGGQPVREARWRVRRPDGSWRVLSGSAEPLRRPDGSSAGAALVIRDETERLAAEEERTRLIDALGRSNRELDQFAYVASHDLKAPLRGIGNLVQWIEEDGAGELSPKLQSHLDLMRSRVLRMEALIDGILAYSRAGRSRTAAQPVPLDEVLQEVLLLLAPEPGVVVATATPLPQLWGERSALQQVLLNLVGNAIKHAPGGPIEVAAHDRGSHWQLTVSDRGPGIAAEYHDRIWGMFQTLQSRDRVEGTGIGLAVVRKIVDAQGGRTWVESEPGRGAAFHFTWPKSARGATT